MVFHKQRSSMGRSDGPIFLSGDLARLLVQSYQETWTRVMIPREQHGIVQDKRTQPVTPCHLGVTESGDVTIYPNWFSIVRVACNVRIAKGDVHGIPGDSGRIHGKVGVFVRPLVHAKAEVMPPKLFAIFTVKAKRQ